MIAAARELERRMPDRVTTAWWKEERGRRVFVDFNQNTRDRTIASAYSLRPIPGAPVSTPVTWEELAGLTSPAELNLFTVPERLADGDPWAGMRSRPQSLEPLLALHERDVAAGLGDAPWPPVYPKQPHEPPRVAPSRAKRED